MPTTLEAVGSGLAGGLWVFRRRVVEDAFVVEDMLRWREVLRNMTMWVQSAHDIAPSQEVARFLVVRIGNHTFPFNPAFILRNRHKWLGPRHPYAHRSRIFFLANGQPMTLL